jgi:hypothetical protein
MADGETELVRELRALAGVRDGDSFDVVVEGLRIRVVYSGGSSSSLVLKVLYDEVAQVTPGAGYRGHAGLAAIRPMAITLRPEGDTDRMAKESGMNVEFQTGDAAFDHATYIDTLTPADVLAHVLGEDARYAVTELFALGFSTIEIDNTLFGEITATKISFPSRVRPDPEGARAVDAFARLARAMPRVSPLPGRHAAHPLRGVNVTLGILAALTFFASFPFYCGVIADGRCPNEMSTSEVITCVGPGVPGALGGLVVAVICGAVAARFTRRYRGRSDSARHGSAFAWLVAVIALAVSSSVFSYVIVGRP